MINLDETKGINQEGTAPLYQQLASYIREKIYAKQWGAREKLPSEHEFMGAFGLARGTVRKAIKILVGEGLVVQEHGRGTFVAASGPSYPAGVRPLSFADALRDQGLSFTTRVLYKAVMAVPPDVAIELEIEPDEPVLFLRRVRSVDGEPIICQESWSNLRECPGLDDADFTNESMFDAVERCSGRKVKYSVIRYTAHVAGKEYGRYLCCEENTAILMLEQTIRLVDDVPVERSCTCLKPGQSVVGTAVQPDLR